MRSSELFAALAAAMIAWSAALPDAWSAPPTAADKAEAQRLYVEGKSLRDKGQTAEAIAALRRSHDLAPTPVTRLELARTLVSASQLVEAHALLASISAMPVAPTETKKSAEARNEADALAASVLARIPRVTLRVTSSDEGGAVTLDGAAVDAARLGVEQPIDPGVHVAVLAAGVRRTERTFTIAAGEVQTVDLALEPLPPPPVVVPPPLPPAAPPPPASEPGPRPPPTEETDQGGSPAIPIAFTIAGISLATGALTGVVAIVQADELREKCTNNECTGDEVDLLSTHQAVTTTSTIAFALGGAAAAVGVVLVLIDDDEPRPKTALRARWSGTGLAVEGTWH